MEIISLTEKGQSLTHSTRVPSSGNYKDVYGYKTIHFIGRVGGRTTFDKICFFVFGNDLSGARSVVSYLKNKGYVVGD